VKCECRAGSSGEGAMVEGGGFITAILKKATMCGLVFLYKNGIIK